MTTSEQTETKMKFEIKSRWSDRVVFEAEIECSADASNGVKLGLAARAAYNSRADLSGADLSRAVLSRADLSDADLSDADLSDADLSRAVLSRADLSGAVLSRADLSDADLSDADLSRADLSRAVLSGADLSDADLSRADLSRADLSRADLSDADLSDAVLRPFQADLWMTLTQNRNEAAGVVRALREGRVNGSTYSGDCACLVGTVANVRGCAVEALDKDSNRPAERWFMMISPGDTPDKDTGGGFAAKLALEWCEEWCLLNGIDTTVDAGSAVAGDA